MTSQDVVTCIATVALVFSVFMIGVSHEREKSEPTESTNDDCKITEVK
jgi:hypothetical protein